MICKVPYLEYSKYFKIPMVKTLVAWKQEQKTDFAPPSHKNNLWQEKLESFHIVFHPKK